MGKIQYGFIPAAGKGSRLANLPLIKILPKPMLPILNRPIVEYVVDRLKNNGIKEIYITISNRGRVIKDYFQNGQKIGVKIHYLEEEPQGLAASIGLAEKVISQPFFVILGDDFTVGDDSLADLEKTFWQKRAWVVTAAVEEKNKESLKRTNCLVVDKSNRLIKAVEKPNHPVSNLRGCGIYLFHPNIFEFIKKTPISFRGQKEITDTIDLLAQQGRAYVSHLRGININVNTLEDLRAATNLLLNEQKLQR